MFWEIRSEAIGTQLVRANTIEAAVKKWREKNAEFLDEFNCQPSGVEEKYEDQEVVL